MSTTAVVTGRHRATTQRAVSELTDGRAAPVAPVAPAVRRSVAHRLLGLVVNLLLLLGVAAFLLIAVGPHVLGYRTATMLTGSMEPGIMPGDVVVTVPKPATELAVGDVISYHIPVEDHRVETHRVTKVVHRADGRTVFQTKGDNNENVDPWTATIRSGDTVWQMKAVVPKAGSAIRTLRAPAVQHGVFWVAFGGLMLLGLSLIWGKDGKGAGSDAAKGSEDDDVEQDEAERGALR